MAKKQPAELKLEDAIGRLEKIVESLESGETDLEKSIELFAEGRKLGTQALKKLESLERKVQILLKDEEGELAPQDFEEEDDEDSEE